VAHRRRAASTHSNEHRTGIAVSRYVTDVIRIMRLPRPMKRRPATKGVLDALGERCNDEGFGAWPSVATIAGESEISERTVDACLRALQKKKFISEQAPPNHHRPRTWRLNLKLIRAHVTDKTALKKLDQWYATSGSQKRGSGSKKWTSGSQKRGSGSHDRADDPMNRVNQGNRSRRAARAAGASQNIVPFPSHRKVALGDANKAAAERYRKQQR
jgi:hypothetical protein